MNNKLFSEQLRQIKIDVNDNHQKFAVFERFSDFAPFVAEHYGSDKKILLIWESYYTTSSKSWDIINFPEKWYFDSPQADIDGIKEFAKVKEKEEYCRHWNFASKMHPKGIDRKSRTFSNVENILKKYFPKEKNPFEFCAGYNFYLRPAETSKTIGEKSIDNEIAAKTLKEVIRILTPEYVVFFSKKSYEEFKDYKKEFPTVVFKAFTHPACRWWNKAYGKERQSGKDRFKDFLEKKVFSTTA